MREIAQAIDAELAVAMGVAGRVRELCDRLQGASCREPSATPVDTLVMLAHRLRERGGAIAEPVFALVSRAAAAPRTPWPVLRELLHACEHAFVREALGIALARARAGSLAVDDAVVGCLAELTDGESGPWKEPEVFRLIRELLCSPRESAAPPADPLIDLYLRAESPRHRRLAARLLDDDGRLPAPEVAARLLGDEAHAFLAPFLSYTRARHMDLLHLAPAGPGVVPALGSLRRAVAAAGESLVREIVTELGWPRVCAGLEVQRYTGVAIGGSIPFHVRPGEAELLLPLPGARRTGESLLIVAHGGWPASSSGEAGVESAAARFRSLNLAHAHLLDDIMEVAPLDVAKVERLLAVMDRVVEEFAALFAGRAEECAIVPAVYQELKRRILEGVARERAAPHLSAETTRLVLAFEDPRTPGEVRSLHGLKRYLHQRGLRLGFHLVEAGGATNRTVDLLMCGPGLPLQRLPAIDYVDFEPDPAGPAAGRIPYPVAIVVEGFGRQLLHGHRDFPRVRVFCYGNEVHYFLGYRAHPAFLRVDFSPPLLGGMIDLEFYGVSKLEMAQHPDVGLEALRLFFHRLEFDCSVESTRVRARYDKERALDLTELRAKAEALFRLAPYLMDLDWILGGLDLDADARREAAEAWAGRFVAWGALPLAQTLTRNRQSILAAIAEGPSGPAEVPWPGEGPYRDRFSPPDPACFAALRRRLRTAGLDLPPAAGAAGLPGQLALEREVLLPLREALERGEILPGPGGLRTQAPDLFARISAPERFAAILAEGKTGLASAARVARLVSPLERSLRFGTTGSVNGHEVQCATLVLGGERMGLSVLRDTAGIARLALCARGTVLWRRRSSRDLPWTPTPVLEPAELSALLRAEGYLAAGTGPADDPAGDSPRAIRARFLGAPPPRQRPPGPGERRADGLKASPGRAAGPARFGTAGRRPEDLDGAVLVAPSIRPEDSVFLYHCAGIVSTGGGILSHAGLIATEFRKPALIVPGEWRVEAHGVQALDYRTTEYDEEEREVRGIRIAVRRNVAERPHVMREGDLVVVDADAGTMRVLGQEGDVLALHEGLRALAALDARLAAITDDGELLAARGRRLRTQYMVGRILEGLTDPALACHAVEELLLGPPLRQHARREPQNARFLATLTANPVVGEAVRGALQEAIAELTRRARHARQLAARRIPTSTSALEILALLHDVRRRRALREGAIEALPAGVAPHPESGQPIPGEVEAAARGRLRTLQAGLTPLVAGSLAGEPPPRLRHALREMDRIERSLGEPPGRLLESGRARLARHDAKAVGRLSGRDVLEAAVCGFETHPLVGWKAANLAEVERLAGSRVVPGWFAVTDRAFQRMLARPPGKAPSNLPEDLPAGRTLGEAIEAILAASGLDSARRSARIRALWDRTPIPEDLACGIAEACRRLDRDAASERGGPAPAGAGFVAVRSSALEEDTEQIARAGEFDTFLFVRGEQAVIEHVRRAWAGLWTERAIHHRTLPGASATRPAGGVIVQRMIPARASGVLQTINAADGDFREMVINAGLGLGEGIVSGTVAADHIVVARPEPSGTGPLRFRYTTADKREKVVFNERSGAGTVRAGTLYHERLRPALEYAELAELVRISSRLEEGYGHPLDIEFAIEGARVWILQVRPVPAALSVPLDTRETRP